MHNLEFMSFPMISSFYILDSDMKVESVFHFALGLKILVTSMYIQKMPFYRRHQDIYPYILYTVINKLSSRQSHTLAQFPQYSKYHALFLPELFRR